MKSEWIADQRAEAKRQAFEAMKARYEIVLPRAAAHSRAVARLSQDIANAVRALDRSGPSAFATRTLNYRW